MGQKKGMLVLIVRPMDGSSTCYLNRFHRATQMILIGDGVPEIFEPGKDDAVGYLQKSQFGRILVSPVESEDQGSFAFGGAFVYSSDSRFPSDQPIHIHDRDMSLER